MATYNPYMPYDPYGDEQAMYPGFKSKPTPGLIAPGDISASYDPFLAPGYTGDPLNPWGTAGPVQPQYTIGQNGEDNAYWSPEAMSAFNAAGFQSVPIGPSGSFLYNGQPSSQWSDETLNQARMLGVAEGTHNVQLNGQEYQQLGDQPFGDMPPEAFTALQNSGQIIYDPTYGYLVPADVYSMIAAEYGTDDNFFDKYGVYLAMAGMGAMAGVYGSTLAAGEAAGAGGYGAGVGSGFEGGTTVGGAGFAETSPYWNMTAGVEPTTAVPGAVEGGTVVGAPEYPMPPPSEVATFAPPLAQPASTSLIPGISDQLLGGIALGGFGYLGAQQQTKAFEDMAEAERARVAPYDQKLQESYAPDFNLWEQPGYEGALEKNAEIVTRQVTAQMGNPANNPAAEQEIQRRMDELYFQQLAAYRSGLTQAAGLSTGAVPAQVGAIQSTGQGYNALGYGAAYGLSQYPMGGVVSPGVTGTPGAPVVYIGGVPYYRGA